MSNTPTGQSSLKASGLLHDCFLAAPHRSTEACWEAFLWPSLEWHWQAASRHSSFFAVPLWDWQEGTVNCSPSEKFRWKWCMKSSLSSVQRSRLWLRSQHPPVTKPAYQRIPHWETATASPSVRMSLRLEVTEGVSQGAGGNTRTVGASCTHTVSPDTKQRCHNFTVSLPSPSGNSATTQKAFLCCPCLDD